MTPLEVGLLICVVTLLVLATGIPIAFGLGVVSLGFLIVFDGWRSVNYLAQTLFSGLDDFTLVSIPMFVIMGAAVASSRAGGDLYEALNRWLHKVPGSLVISNLGACAIFAALTGSSPATSAAIGKMGIPEMRRRGYPADLATGAIAARRQQRLAEGEQTIQIVLLLGCSGLAGQREPAFGKAMQQTAEER